MDREAESEPDSCNTELSDTSDSVFWREETCSDEVETTASVGKVTSSAVVKFSVLVSDATTVSVAKASSVPKAAPPITAPRAPAPFKTVAGEINLDAISSGLDF
ncbi:hypothetical protein ACXM1Q_003080 [Streptococcus sp. 10F2]